MKYQIAILSWLAVTSLAAGEETLREFSWEKLAAAGELQAGRVIHPDEASAPAELLIENTSGKAQTIHLLTIEDPPITSSTYAIKGHIRYQDVEGTAYLEMLSYFPEGPYFSKTLAPTGPFGRISGSSDRRPFILPFFMKEGDAARLHKIEVSLVLPGRATVYLGPLRLVQYAPGENPLLGTEQLVRFETSESTILADGQWWSDRSAGVIERIGGGFIGCMGALIGCLAGTGRARSFVLSLMKLLLVVGLAVLAAGVVAMALSQPRCVYYPLLLGGGFTAMLMASLLPSIRKRYEQIEMRKMDAMDAK
jgi:hypothetical protein